MAKTIYLNYQSQIRTSHFFTIDPGCRRTGGTGIALFNNTDDRPLWFYQTKTTNKQIKMLHNEMMELALMQLRVHLTALCQNRNLAPHQTTIFIEEPQYFDSFVGQVAASSGSLMKLIFFYGRLYQLLTSMSFPVVPVQISHWKGQLKKEQVAKRIERILKKKYVGDVQDAVGIGLFIKGLL